MFYDEPLETFRKKADELRGTLLVFTEKVKQRERESVCV